MALSARCCDKRISSLTLKRTNPLRVERLQRGINKKFCFNSVQSNHSGNKSLINCCVIGCFPLTWANRSVHGLGKWYAKFRTGKFRPGFAFTTLCESVPFIGKRPRRPETGIKDGFEEWNTNFCLEYSVGKKRTTFSDVPLFPEIFRWNDPKSRVPFTFLNFQENFPESFCKW